MDGMTRRDIKFRAWHNQEQRMIHNIQREYDGVEEDCFAQYIGQESNYGRDGRGDKYEVMQYTGFEDKYGREIYEGDLVLSSLPVGDVASEIAFMWGSWYVANLMCGGALCSMTDTKFLDSIQIVGNKFENPELMEVK